jgi:hypothetical protein
MRHHRIERPALAQRGIERAAPVCTIGKARAQGLARGIERIGQRAQPLRQARSSRSRTCLASPAEAPAVPTATTTGLRSTSEGVVKSHSAGRSTTLTSNPAPRAQASAEQASGLSCAMNASRAPMSMPWARSSITCPPARSTRRRLACAASPWPSTITGWPAMR